MKHCSKSFAVVALALCAAAFSFAQDKPTGFRADLLDQIEYVQKQIVDLENAIPDKKMSWRPAKGVRSVSEVYMHIVMANYLLAKFAGVELPPDVKLPEFSEMGKAEASITNKKEIAEKLEKSFTFLKSAISKMSDADLEKPVTFFGQETNVRGMLLTAFAHQHEHLGQSIAYARMNGVVPPWTAAKQAPETKEKKSGM
jgi:uncharacterized damage-inducible protein DinB